MPSDILLLSGSKAWCQRKEGCQGRMSRKEGRKEGCQGRKERCHGKKEGCQGRKERCQGRKESQGCQGRDEGRKKGRKACMQPEPMIHVTCPHLPTKSCITNTCPVQTSTLHPPTNTHHDLTYTTNTLPPCPVLIPCLLSVFCVTFFSTQPLYAITTQPSHLFHLYSIHRHFYQYLSIDPSIQPTIHAAFPSFQICLVWKAQLVMSQGQAQEQNWGQLTATIYMLKYSRGAASLDGKFITVDDFMTDIYFTILNFITYLCVHIVIFALDRPISVFVLTTSYQPITTIQLFWPPNFCADFLR